MAYETGSASSIGDLFDKFEAFCRLVAGYTTNAYAVDGTGKRLHIQKNIGGTDYYFNFRSYIGENTGSGLYQSSQHTLTGSILGNAGTGYNGANPWYNQPGVFTFSTPTVHYVTGGIANIVGAPPSYHAFHFSGAGYDCIYFIVEYPAGQFQRIMFGLMPKYGTWTGGQFFFASVDHTKNVSGGNCITVAGVPPISVESPIAMTYVSGFDGFTGWLSARQYSSIALLYMRDSYFLQEHVMHDAPNQWNGISPLDQFIICADADAAPTTSFFTEADPFQPIGYLPHFYVYNVEGAVPGGEITITTDTFRTFPLTAKSAAAYNAFANPPHSGWIGCAIKSN